MEINALNPPAPCLKEHRNEPKDVWRINFRSNRKTPCSEAEWKLLLREYPHLIRRPVVLTSDGIFSQGFSDNGFKKRFGID